MNYAEVLAGIGLSQGSLEFLIVFVIVAIGVGLVLFMYWKFLMLGVAAVFMISVFAHHGQDFQPLKDIDAIDSKVEEIVSTKAEAIAQTDKQMFLEDCISLTHKPKMCGDLWKEREDDERKLN